jgi:hypothetical protein
VWRVIVQVGQIVCVATVSSIQNRPIVSVVIVQMHALMGITVMLANVFLVALVNVDINININSI